MDRIMELLVESHFLLDDYKSELGDTNLIITDVQYYINLAISKLHTVEALDISDDDQ